MSLHMGYIGQSNIMDKYAEQGIACFIIKLLIFWYCRDEHYSQLSMAIIWLASQNKYTHQISWERYLKTRAFWTIFGSFLSNFWDALTGRAPFSSTQITGWVGISGSRFWTRFGPVFGTNFGWQIRIRNWQFWGSKIDDPKMAQKNIKNGSKWVLKMRTFAMRISRT